LDGSLTEEEFNAKYDEVLLNKKVSLVINYVERKQTLFFILFFQKQLANTKKNFTEFGVTLVKTSDLLKEKEKVRILRCYLKKIQFFIVHQTVESLKGQLQDSENKFNKCEQILFNATEEIESLKQNKKVGKSTCSKNI